MGRLIDADSAYTALTDYYHHKTDAQHMALIDKQTALDALMAKRERLLDHGLAGAEHILTHCGYNVIDELPTVPAIPIDWIKAQIPDSTEFYAVVTATILQHLIDEYRKEKDNRKTE